jgi:DNA-binding transcriptional MerR regulator
MIFPMDQGFTIQEVSKRTGLSVHTLRYYEKAQLLAPVDRSEGGQRRYQERDIDSLLFLTRLRLTGMPIHQVRLYAQLARQGAQTIEARKTLLWAHRQSVLDQIAGLQENLSIVDYKISLYEEGWIPTSSDDPCLDKLRRLCSPRWDLVLRSPDPLQPNNESL